MARRVRSPPSLHSSQLLKEEEDLYSSEDVKVQPSNLQRSKGRSKAKDGERPTIDSFSTFSFKVNDTLIQSGPLGHSVMGPTVNPTTPWPGKLYPERIFCSGYGRDGGLSILSTPGSSSSSNFLAEIDVKDMDDVYCLPEAGAVVLAKRFGGAIFLKKEGEER